MFCRDLRHQKTGIPELLCDLVSVILHLAISVADQLLTDRHTTVAYTVLARRHMVNIYDITAVG